MQAIYCTFSTYTNINAKLSQRFLGIHFLLTWSYLCTYTYTVQLYVPCYVVCTFACCRSCNPNRISLILPALLLHRVTLALHSAFFLISLLPQIMCNSLVLTTAASAIWKNSMRGVGKRLTQHKVRAKAVFSSRPCLNAIFLHCTIF